MSAHSVLGPSAAERWINCPGSVAATAGMPDTTSEFAAEGTAAHTLSEWCRVQGKRARDFLGRAILVEGYEFSVDEEMADNVQEFVDRCAEFEGDAYYELRVSYDSWIPGGFGTSDDIRIRDGVCKIVDLKYGKGVPVDAVENEQLMLYALGVYQTLGWLYEFDKFILAVCQPRLDSYSEWEITIEELLEWVARVASCAAEEASQEDATFKAGSWCRFCKIRATCRVRAEHVFSAAVGDFEDLSDAVQKAEQLGQAPTLTNDEVAQVLRVWPSIAEYGESLKAYAAKELLAGRAVGDFKFVAGRGSRDFTAEESVVVSTATSLGAKKEDLYTKPALLSVAKIEKIVGAKHFKEGKGNKEAGKMAALVRHNEGKPTLVPGSDPRPAVTVDPSAEFDSLDDAAMA